MPSSQISKLLPLAQPLKFTLTIGNCRGFADAANCFFVFASAINLPREICLLNMQTYYFQLKLFKILLNYLQNL